MLLTSISIWQEAFSDFVNCIFNRSRPIAVFNRLFLIRSQIRQRALIFLNFNLAAHIRSEILAEIVKVDVTTLILVKDILHDSLNLLLGGLNLNLFQMFLEIFIADKSIPVNIKSLKELVRGWFRNVRCAFNLEQDFSDSLSISVIAFDIDWLCKSDVFVNKLGWWVSAHLASKFQ